MLADIKMMFSVWLCIDKSKSKETKCVVLTAELQPFDFILLSAELQPHDLTFSGVTILWLTISWNFLQIKRVRLIRCIYLQEIEKPLHLQMVIDWFYIV